MRVFTIGNSPVVLVSLIIFLVWPVIPVEWAVAGGPGPGLEVLETVARRPRAEDLI